jgi:beta-lactamase regulating signal transducer with metallopeptidase domain
MRGFIIELLICSVSMSFIVSGYMLITPLLSKKYAPKWIYYAWLVLTIGLVIPFRPHGNLAMVTINMPLTRAPLGITSLTGADANAVIDFTAGSIPLADNGVAQALSAVSWWKMLDWWQITAMAWAIGALAFLRVLMCRAINSPTDAYRRGIGRAE